MIAWNGTLLRLSLAALVSMAVGAPARADCDDRKPILYLAISSSEGYADMATITDFADRVVGNHLKTLPGVADVVMFGERRPVLRISLDRSRLGALGLAPHDVEEALQRQDIEPSPDRTDRMTIEVPASEFNPPSPYELAEIILSEEAGAPVRLMDIAVLDLATADSHSAAHYAGKDVVALGVINQPDTGALAVWYAVSRTLETIRPMLPGDMQVDLVSPFSIVIEPVSGD
jgi:multidrug efflux pump